MASHKEYLTNQGMVGWQCYQYCPFCRKDSLKNFHQEEPGPRTPCCHHCQPGVKPPPCGPHSMGAQTLPQATSTNLLDGHSPALQCPPDAGPEHPGIFLCLQVCSQVLVCSSLFSFFLFLSSPRICWVFWWFELFYY